MTTETVDLRRELGTHSPKRGQVYAAWRVASRVHMKAPDILFYAGVYAAAEWTLDLTDTRPVAPYVPGYEPPLPVTVQPDGSFKDRPRHEVFMEELDLIGEVLDGKHSVRKHGDYVVGASSWLAWWVGATEEALWVPRQRKASA